MMLLAGAGSNKKAIPYDIVDTYYTLTKYIGIDIFLFSSITKMCKSTVYHYLSVCNSCNISVLPLSVLYTSSWC